MTMHLTIATAPSPPPPSPIPPSVRLLSGWLAGDCLCSGRLQIQQPAAAADQGVEWDGEWSVQEWSVQSVWCVAARLLAGARKQMLGNDRPRSRRPVSPLFQALPASLPASPLLPAFSSCQPLAASRLAVSLLFLPAVSLVCHKRPILLRLQQE